MPASLRSDASGNSAAIQVNGVDRLTLLASGLLQATATPAQFDNSQQLATTEFVRRELGRLSGLTYGNSRTLTAADVGMLCGLATPGTVITLPLGSTVPVGAAFYFWNGTWNAAGTVQRQGSDTIFMSSTQVTSVQCNGGESLTLVWSGSSWYAIGGSATLGAASNAFGSSLATSGWQRLPSGLIVQWGTVTLTSTNAAYNLPITYPNAHLAIVGSDSESAAAGTAAFQAFSTSQFRGICSGNFQASYISIGW